MQKPPSPQSPPPAGTLAPGSTRFGWVPAIAPRLLLSFLLALVLWGWVTTQSNPTETRSFTNIPITAPELPAPLQIAGETGSVTLRVEGPQSIVEAINRSDLSATLDLSEVTGPGSFTVPVSVPLPAPARAVGLDPARLAIVVDETSSRTMPLTIAVTPPKDTSRQVGTITPSVSEVTVSGPARLVDGVTSVVLPIEIGDRTGNFTGQFTAEARNADGQPIPEVDLRPRRIITDVVVAARGRSVPVLIQAEGSPAPGFEAFDRVVTPRVVLLDGPPDIVNDIISVVTEPISVEGATQPVSAKVGLADLPPGVRIVDPADGQFTVVVQVRQRGVTQTLPGQTVVVNNLRPGLTASVEPPQADVVIFAAEDDLRSLQSGELAVSVSADGLEAGTYQLPMSVAVPPGVQWIRTEPEQVTVTIQAGATVAGATPERPFRAVP